MSPAGILALLSEDDPTLLEYALSQLNSSLVNTFWTEISESISAIEQVYENADLPKETRQLAALVASKVYYHLQSLDDALTFALAAGPLFDVETAQSDPASFDYYETIIATCIDKYVDSRAAQEDAASTSGKAATTHVDAVSAEDLDKMQSIVEQMFARCMKDREYRQALGIALDARRLDVIERIFSETKDASLLSYVLEVVMSIVLKLDFRNKVCGALSGWYNCPLTYYSSC
jgi:26S proteasome regulatory subunit N2